MDTTSNTSPATCQHGEEIIPASDRYDAHCDCGMPLVRTASRAAGLCSACRGIAPTKINVSAMDAAANRVRRNDAASRRTKGMIR